MCIAIFAEIRQTILYETGMDLFAKVKSNACKDDFFEQNYVPNKLYTGGPTCVHKGNDIPCVCRWTPKGSIDGSILLDIVKTLDILKTFCDERENVIKVMLLVDDHDSRFDLPFLECINNIATQWCFYIGVPYGTALW